MKKLLCIILCLAVACTTLCIPAGAEGFPVPESVPVTAGSAYFVNLDTGIPVVEINAHQKRSIASLTKMMTALLLVENVPDLDGTVITAPTSIYVPPITGGQASTADIRPGEQVTARSLLYAMLLPSANEAAAIVAYHLGKENVQNFYAMMNARAKELGCLNTNFANPHGLEDMDKGNYSTAYDQYLIAKACWENEIIRNVVSQTSYKMPFTNIHTGPQLASVPDAAYVIQSTVHMQKPSSPVYRDYIRGIKTGSTLDAGRCFASVAVNKNGETYIGIVLGSPYDPAPDGYAYSFHDTAALYDWLFASFSVRPTLDISTPIGEVPVTLSSETDAVKLYPAADLKTVLPLQGAETVLEKVYDIPTSIEAPVKKGDYVGKITVKVQGREIGTVDLLAGADIERNPVLYAGKLIKDFFKSTYFKVVLVLTALFVVAYVLLVSYLKTQTRRKRELQRRRQAQMNADLSSHVAQMPRHAPLPGTQRDMPPRSPFGTPMPPQRPANKPDYFAQERPAGNLRGQTGPVDDFFETDAVEFDFSGTSPDSPGPEERRPRPRPPRRR